MQRYFLHLAYNGAGYHGWQNQPNGISVQETLEKALGNLLGGPTPIVGAGRTDAGVHASDMYAHFETDRPVDTALLTQRLNAYLPQDIVIFGVNPVSERMHARFSALTRTYQYHVITRKDPFRKEYTYRVPSDTDFEAMNRAASILLEYDDFECFSKSHTDVNTFICHITRAQWTPVSDHEWVFTITANRFLRNMVRAIVGTLLEVGAGRSSVEDLHRIIASKNRCQAGMSVPGKALFLTQITYPDE
ncbi:MAG: tRNA pseudouridine(38-40) synthase TruA [Paludibacteraceae bacterium]|nr:tRNA pseudouridine(38-40) synthase TruA [Paludibacteraceae bacterium]